MKEFNTVNKIFVRSNNEIFKILKRYTKSLLLFIFFLVGYHIYKNEYHELINLLKTTIITILVSTIFQYFINLNRGKDKFRHIFKEDNIIASSLIIAMLTYKERLLVILISSIITGIARLMNRNINISSCIYGALFVVLYKIYYINIDTPLVSFSNMLYNASYSQIIGSYGGIKGFLLGTNLYYFSPIISIISFIYLFHKKSIKYPSVISYLTTFIIWMFIYGIISGMNIWFIFFQITTGNILFFSIYALSDYKTTPTTQEGQTIYGIILAILTIILRFIIPELSVIISIILGPTLLTKKIDSISYKLKTDRKFYNLLILSCISFLILTMIILLIIY